MSRRPVNPSRRVGDGSSHPFAGVSNPKSKGSPLLSLGLVCLGAFLIVAYIFSGPGSSISNKFSRGLSCTSELQLAISNLRSAYGNSLQKVLHVGPETCSVVSKLFNENIEAWGIEPYDLEEPERKCKHLVHKGIVRVADIKFPLPYRPRSFSLVLVSDALDYLTPRYLNKTLPDLARVSKDGIVIFSGNPGQQRPKSSESSKFGKPARLRSSSWWIHYFAESRLEENVDAAKKFEQAASEGYTPSCQVFHLKSISYK